MTIVTYKIKLNPPKQTPRPCKPVNSPKKSLIERIKQIRHTNSTCVSLTKVIQANIERIKQIKHTDSTYVFLMKVIQAKTDEHKNLRSHAFTALCYLVAIFCYFTKGNDYKDDVVMGNTTSTAHGQYNHYESLPSQSSSSKTRALPAPRSTRALPAPRSTRALPAPRSSSHTPRSGSRSSSSSRSSSGSRSFGFSRR